MADFEDINQNINLKYTTNADQTSVEVDKLSSSLDKVDEGQAKVSKSAKTTGEAQKKAAGSAKEQGVALESLGGGIGSTVSGMKAMLKQMWLLIANPLVLTIVAIVGSLALLFKAFTSTNEGAHKMDQMMAGVSATIDILRDRFLKIAGAIVKFMSGDFKGAMADGKAAVSGFGDEVAREFKKASDATRELQEVEAAMRSLGETRAKLNRDLAETKEIINDENATYSQKKEAIEKLRKAEGEQTEQELANARKKLKAIQDLNALSDTSDEDFKKESDAKIALYNLETESANNRRAINKADAKADSEEKARLKAISDARKAAQKERLAQMKEIAKAKADLLKEEFDQEEKALRRIQDLNDKTDEDKLARQKERDLIDIERLKKKGVDVRALLVYNEELYATLEQELIQKRADEKAAKEKEIFEKEAEAKNKVAEEELVIEKAIAKQKEEIQQSQFNLAEKAVGFLSVIAGKNKALQKAAIIAENAVSIGKTLIANATGNAQSAAVAAPLLTNPVTAPAAAASLAASTLNNNIATGIGVATSVAATAKALSALGGGGIGGGAVGGTGGTAQPRSGTPNVGFQNSTENQIATTVTSGINNQEPVKAFVVSSEVTTAQSLDRNKIEKNSI